MHAFHFGWKVAKKWDRTSRLAPPFPSHAGWGWHPNPFAQEFLHRCGSQSSVKEIIHRKLSSASIRHRHPLSLLQPQYTPTREDNLNNMLGLSQLSPPAFSYWMQQNLCAVSSSHPSFFTNPLFSFADIMQLLKISLVRGCEVGVVLQQIPLFEFRLPC